MLESRLMEWVKKVVAARESKSEGFADTYAMMLDVDKIIAEEFDREPLFYENK